MAGGFVACKGLPVARRSGFGCAFQAPIQRPGIAMAHEQMIPLPVPVAGPWFQQSPHHRSVLHHWHWYTRFFSHIFNCAKQPLGGDAGFWPQKIFKIPRHIESYDTCMKH